MRFSTVCAWLDYIGSVHSTEIELGLDRIGKVAERLGAMRISCPVITVAGTNGKGSVVAALQSIYQAAGYRVGTYTSPSFISFNERICVNGEMVDDETICKSFDKIDTARGEVSLTPFEYFTLVAMVIFQKNALDVVILEVGLGGRLDAVNVIDPDCAIVTSIGLDHMDRLGDTRELIGFEKAGIFRKDTPAICGDAHPPTSLIDHANKIGAKLSQQGDTFHFSENEQTWSWSTSGSELTALPKTKLLTQNMSTALMAIECMQSDLPVSDQAIRQGMQTIKLTGRIQVIPGDVQEIYDVAHNPDAACVLAKHLQQTKVSGKTYAVFSMLADKDIAATVKALSPQIDAWFVAPIVDKRAATVDMLTGALAESDIQLLQTSERVADAYQLAKQHCQTGDRLVVFGSFRTVGEVMDANSASL